MVSVGVVGLVAEDLLNSKARPDASAARVSG